MDWLHEPALREIALKIIIAALTAILAALGYERTELRTSIAEERVKAERLRGQLARAREQVAQRGDADPEATA